MCRIVLTVIFLLATSLTVTSYDFDVVSDLVTPSESQDTSRALRIKNEQFWQPIVESAGEVRLAEHAALYVEAEATIAKLCLEHRHVRTALLSALSSLRHADAAVQAQADQAAQLASEKLASPTLGGWGDFSFLTGGQNSFALALRRFVEFGGYNSRLRGHIEDRKKDILPSLRTASKSSGNVLRDCHKASEYAFDVLKYDIYERGAPETPEAAKAMASRIVDAAAETRHHFLKIITSSAQGIIRDNEHKNDHPSALVTQTLLAGLDEPRMTFGRETLTINL